MKLINSSSVKKGIILVGVLITLVGLTLHLSVPGTTRSGYPMNVPPMDVAVENLSIPNSIGYGFGIELIDITQIGSNESSAYLLTADQYNDYQSGIPLNETSALISLENGGRDSFETILTEDLNIYLVFTNEKNDTIFWQYYYYLLPASYYPTFTLAFSGSFITILGFAWYFSGWKRWFLVALGIQSILFLVRVFTLSTYSFNLPSVFWDLIHIELYNDYQFFYLSWIPRLWEGAWAYSSELAGYLYPPLWIYTVGLFGSTPSWLPGLVLFAFNAATGILVYKTVFRITNDEVRATFALMFYMLNPLTLFYGAFMWLNPTPYVFFTMLSFYLVLIEKEEFSIASLAIATLYKQLAVVFFPILVILLVKLKTNLSLKNKFVLFLKHTTVYSGIIGLVSLPFLIVSPEAYLNQMILSNTGSYWRLVTFTPAPSIPVHANSFFLWLNFPRWFTDIIAVLIINYVFLILCGILVYGGYALYKSRYENIVEKEKIADLFMKAIFWSFIVVISVQMFYPRGSYKFYLLALTPFAALLFDYKNLDLSMKTEFQFSKHHIFLLLMTWAVFLCYRFVYFWLLGLWVVFYLVLTGELSRIKNGIFRFFIGGGTDTTELEDIYSE